MKAGKALVVAALILTVSAAVAGAGGQKRYSLLDSSKLSQSAIKRLLSEGQLLLINEDEKGNLRLITGGILINKPPEDVYKVITDYEHYPEFMPSVVKAEVLFCSPDKRIQHIRYVVRFKFSILSYTVDYTLKMKVKPPRWMQWDYLEGDLADAYGSWELIPLDGGRRTAAFYSVYSDIRSINWIVKKFVEATPGMEIAINASTCTLVLKSIKARAEKGPTYRLQQ